MATRLPIPWFGFLVMGTATLSGVIFGLATWAVYGNFAGAIHGSVLGAIVGVLTLPILLITAPSFVTQTILILVPRIRFGLRTMLGVVALSAVSLWLTLTAWPAWQRHRLFHDLRHGSESPIACHQAVASIVSLGAAAVPELISCLQQGDLEARRWSVWILEKIGPDARGAIPALLEAAKDPNPEFRHQVLGAFVAIAPDSPEVHDLFSALLEDSDLLTQRVVMMKLQSMGPSAVPILIRALSHRDAAVRHESTEALALLGSDASDAIGALLETWLHDPDPFVRDRADWALCNIGTPIVPQLVERMRSTSDAFLFSWFASLLTMVDNEAAVEFMPRIVQLLGEKDRGTRFRGATSLARIGNRGVAAIREASESPDESIRAGANEAIDLLAAMDAWKSGRRRRQIGSDREAPIAP